MQMLVLAFTADSQLRCERCFCLISPSVEFVPLVRMVPTRHEPRTDPFIVTIDATGQPTDPKPVEGFTVELCGAVCAQCRTG